MNIDTIHNLLPGAKLDKFTIQTRGVVSHMPNCPLHTWDQLFLQNSSGNWNLRIVRGSRLLALTLRHDNSILINDALILLPGLLLVVL